MFQNPITSARKNIFWSVKKPLVADTPFSQKQQKLRFWLSPGRRSPGSLIALRGQRQGGMFEVDFRFFVVSYYRGKWQLPGTIFGMKKMFLDKVIELWNRENTYNYFDRDFPTIFVKSLLLQQILKYSLETW